MSKNEYDMGHRLKLILNEIKSDDSVLDVGCVEHNLERSKKESWLHKHLVDRANKVIGIDILNDEVKQLRKSGFNVMIADAENFDLKKKFSVIVAGELIEHLSNPGKFLDCCNNHLEEDGKLILTTPNVWYYQFFISILFMGKIPSFNIEHTCWYDRKSLYLLLQRHGFEIVKKDFIIPNKIQRGYLISNIIYKLKFRQIGGESLFIVAKKN